NVAQAAPPPLKPDPEFLGGATRPVGGPAGRLRARTLIVLRWMAIAGQLGAVLATGLVLRFPVPYVPCVALIGAAAWLNVVLSLSPASQRAATPREASGHLA